MFLQMFIGVYTFSPLNIKCNVMYITIKQPLKSACSHLAPRPMGLKRAIQSESSSDDYSNHPNTDQC